jgi:hypothetical protein
VKEGAILAKHKIRLLPIARQTRNVAGDEKAGATDAKLNVAALAKASGGKKDIYLFLDVEDDTSTGSPAVSPEYWKGWSKAVSAGGFLPCLYVRQGSADTFTALTKAKLDPEALWIARWQFADGKPHPVPAKWQPGKLGTFKHQPKDIKVWQYQDGPHFDCDMINPEKGVKEELSSHLILPEK